MRRQIGVYAGQGQIKGRHMEDDRVEQVMVEFAGVDVAINYEGLRLSSTYLLCMLQLAHNLQMFQ